MNRAWMAICLVGWLLTGCSSDGATEGATGPGTGAGAAGPGGGAGAPGGPGGGAGGGPGGVPQGPRAVRTATVDEGVVEVGLRLIGDLRVRDVVEVAPDVSGRLESLLVDEGAQVVAGQPLASLESSVERDRLGEARAAVDAARARVALAEANRAEFEADLARRRLLFEADAMPAAEFAALEARGPVMDAEIAVALAALDQARAAQRTAETGVARRQVLAPFDGVVQQRRALLGAQVGPQAPVVSLAAPASLEAVMPVPETAMAQVGIGARARLTLAGSSEPIEAAVTRIGVRGDEASRTVEVAVGATAWPGGARAGGAVTAFLVTGSSQPGPVVPNGAIVRGPQGTSVWRVDGDVVTRVPVTVVLEGTERSAVDGIAAGTTVVVGPPRGLEDGAAVVVPAATPPREGGSR